MASSLAESSFMLVDPAYQAPSSCDKKNHSHCWPTTGELEIERCEHYCLYCRGPKALKKWSSAWFLRRHVRETHAKTDFPGLVVSEGWSKRPTGNARPISKKQRAPGSNKKRAGTKKDRVAIMRLFEEAGNAKSQVSLPTPSQKQIPSAPTAAMEMSSCCQNSTHPAVMTSFTITTQVFESMPERALQTRPESVPMSSLEHGIDPGLLSLDMDVSGVLDDWHTSRPAADALNFDDYLVQDREEFDAGTIDTSTSSEASFADGNVPTDETTTCNDVSTNSSWTIESHPAEDHSVDPWNDHNFAHSADNFDAPNYDYPDIFDEMFSGHQFGEPTSVSPEDFAIDPVFDTL